MTSASERQPDLSVESSRAGKTLSSSIAGSDPPVTPDGRYIVVRGRLWRHADPDLPAEQKTRLVAELMNARQSVGMAMRSKDGSELIAARARVNAAKVDLGERGPVWWTDGAPDQNRRMVRNTGYADWYAALDGTP